MESAETKSLHSSTATEKECFRCGCITEIRVADFIVLLIHKNRNIRNLMRVSFFELFDIGRETFLCGTFSVVTDVSAWVRARRATDRDLECVSAKRKANAWIYARRRTDRDPAGVIPDKKKKICNFRNCMRT